MAKRQRICPDCRKPVKPDSDTVVAGRHDACLRTKLQVHFGNTALKRVVTSEPTKLRQIRHIALVNFRASEATNLQEAVPKDIRDRLGPNDVVALISMTRKQVAFCHGFTKLDLGTDARKGKGRTKELAHLVIKVRLLGNATWNPLMLANYAEMANIPVDLRKFETHYKNLVTEVAKALPEGSKES